MHTTSTGRFPPKHKSYFKIAIMKREVFAPGLIVVASG